MTAAPNADQQICVHHLFTSIKGDGRIMKTLPLLLVSLLALCLMPSALALKCYECTNIPGFSASQCSSTSDDIKSVECGGFLDRCMTITGRITVPGSGSMDIELRNCSSSILCNPDSPWGMCNILNTTTGLMSKCNTECCEGDLCNGAVHMSGLVAGFTAILLTVVLNLFLGFY